jgi:hypothetical protein
VGRQAVRQFDETSLLRQDKVTTDCVSRTIAAIVRHKTAA